MTTILTKKKDTTGAPAPGDLTNAAGGAELAVNTADKRLYTKDSGGTVVEIGTNPTILNIDNIQIDGSTISSTNTNGDINITPNGTGSVVVSKLQVTGGFQLDGNVTVGDSSADTLTINSTITSNLIFTDNTYDIGASGATRPRNLFLAGNATIGGNQTLTGTLTVDSTTDSSSTTTGSIQTDGGMGVAKALYVGTTLNVAGNTTLGDASTDTVTVNGYMGVGGVGSSAIGLRANHTALTGVSQDGIQSSPTGTSAATTQIRAFSAQPGTAAAAFTCASVYGYRALNAVLGAGSTITNQYGFYADDQTSGTNNYGAFLNVSSGANKWNIYASGTADNYFAGQVQLGAGTVSAPALSTTGDTNTGIFFPAADTIAFTDGGVERMRINSSGSLLINTTTDVGAQRLSINGGIGLIGSNTNQQLDFYRINGSSIVASDNTVAQILARGYNGSSYNVMASIVMAVDGTPGASNDMPGRIVFNTTADGAGSPTERMRIDSSGNVGIGTTSPGALLHTYTSTQESVRFARNSTSSSAYVTFYANNSSSVQVQYAGILGDVASSTAGSHGGNLLFYTTGSGTSAERARITSGGFFKASNDGTYYNSTGGYHEFRNTTNDAGTVFSMTNASFTEYANGIFVTRAASSVYSFARYYSSGISDVEFNFRGDGNGYADGTFNNNGADYAEFFESVTGAALTLGATVVLDGNKVREATDQDPVSAIMGVVRPKEPSKASMVVGNTAWNKWANKYLTDDFDRYIMEDHDVVEWTDEDGKQHSYESHNIPAGVTVPDDAVIKTHDDKGNKFQHYKLNPAWNPDVEYVNRENRPEWIIVGLVGQVKILKGQPVNDRWIKMRDVSETVEEWMIR